MNPGLLVECGSFFYCAGVGCFGTFEGCCVGLIWCGGWPACLYISGWILIVRKEEDGVVIDVLRIDIYLLRLFSSFFLPPS